MDLHKKKCVPCRGDIPPFTKEQIDEYLKYLTDWKVLINEKKIESFNLNFLDDLSITKLIA